MDNYYLIIKSLHIISFTAWMAGMFYLPRIFVYHSENSLNDETYQKFLIMQRKLIRIIMTPAMLSTWLFGILLCLYNTNYLTELWLIVKIFLVLVLSATHGFFVRCYKNFLINKNTYGHKFFRIVNEIPTILLIAIVFLVIFGPSF